MKKRIALIAAAFIGIAVYFQNCSMAGSEHTDLTVFGSTCSSLLKKPYLETYYPHFKKDCVPCHDNAGQGIGWFAHTTNASLAFQAFLNTGRSKIKIKIVDSGHPGELNGPAQQAFLDANESRWLVAEKKVEECNEATAIKTTDTNTSVGQVNAANGDPNRDPWKKLEWDLSKDIKNENLLGKINLIIGIQYREAQNGGVKVGYEFRNLYARLKPGLPSGTQYGLRNVRLYLNGETLEYVTAFEATSAVIGAETDAPLITGATSMAVLPSWNAATDKFGLRIAVIRDANGESIGGGDDGGGGGDIPVPNRVSYTELTNGGALSVFSKNCFGCHSGASPAGSFNITDYNAAFARRDAIVSRMNDPNNPMPRAGLLGQFDRDLVRKWRDIGAPQN